ncbi:hypothetical protein [Lewinella sp. LCG006]|uniref:hypothetical protein n=1 Tax=Lewinella sp. LCG006 TaxID=3231911 RepID=UPI003460824B
MISKNEIKSILATLDAKEWLWLEKFLSSPYHNSDERLVVLHHLLRAAPGFELEGAEVYPTFFPGQAYVARKWGDLLRKYLQVLHAFLVQQELRESPTTQAKLAIDGRKRRKLYALLQAQIDAYEAAIATENQAPWDTANAYRVRWQQQYEFPGLLPQKEDFQRATEYNRLLFCLLELRYCIEQQSVIKDDYEKNRAEIEPVLALAQSLSTTWPLLQLNLRVYEAFCAEKLSSELIDACEQCYYALFPTLYPYDRTFFFTKLMMLHNRHSVNQGREGLERFFGLLKFAFDRDLYLDAEKMTETTFINICMVGIAVKEFAWVEQFREKYLPWVSVEDATNISLLSAAQLAFGRGDYGAVYRLTSQASRMPLEQRLQMYGLQIKALTELYLTEESTAFSLRDFLRNADRFLRYNSKVPARSRESVLNLIKIIHKLVVMRERGERPAKIRQYLEKMQQAAKTIAAGEWLREKIAQI